MDHLYIINNWDISPADPVFLNPLAVWVPEELVQTIRGETIWHPLAKLYTRHIPFN